MRSQWPEKRTRKPWDCSLALSWARSRDGRLKITGGGVGMHPHEDINSWSPLKEPVQTWGDRNVAALSLGIFHGDNGENLFWICLTLILQKIMWFHEKGYIYHEHAKNQRFSRNIFHTTFFQGILKKGENTKLKLVQYCLIVEKTSPVEVHHHDGRIFHADGLISLVGEHKK